MASFVYIGTESSFKSGIPDKYFPLVSEGVVSTLNDYNVLNFINYGELAKTNYIGSGPLNVDLSADLSIIDVMTAAIGRKIEFTDKSLFGSKGFIYGTLNQDVTDSTATDFEVNTLDPDGFDGVDTFLVGGEVLDLVSANKHGSPPPNYTFTVTRGEQSTYAKRYFAEEAFFGLVDSTASDVYAIVPNYYTDVHFNLPVSLCMQSQRDIDYYLYNGVKVNALSFTFSVDTIAGLSAGLIAAREAVDSTSAVGAYTVDPHYPSLIDPLTLRLYKGLQVAEASGFDIDIINDLRPDYFPGDDEAMAYSLKSRTVAGSVDIRFYNRSDYQSYLDGDIFNFVMVAECASSNDKVIVCARRATLEPFTPVRDGYVITYTLNFNALNDVMIFVERAK